MAQVTIYLPDAVEREVRRAAKRARKSVSAFLTDLARAHVRPTAWPAAWADLYGSWAGELPEIEDRPPESEESLIRVQLERDGCVIGGNELLIAAICVAADATW